jgi:amino acid transporter
MIYAIGRRRFVHPSLARVHAEFGTPVAAIVLMGALTAGASMLGDAILVPISEVGSLAVGVGWLSACVAYLARRRGGNRPDMGRRSDDRKPPSGREPATMAIVGAVVSVAIILMKIVPGVPGSFTRAEWIAFAGWSGLGLVFWLARRKSSN